MAYTYISTGCSSVTFNKDYKTTFAVTPVKIKKVIYNDPATIVYFSDNSKSVVKRHENDEFDEQTGLLMCIAKRFLGKEELHRALRKNTKNYD